MIIRWWYTFLCRTDDIDYRRTDWNTKFEVHKQGQTVPNMIIIMGQPCIFLFQVEQNKTDKNWARYSIVEDLANKYKQLSAVCIPTGTSHMTKPTTFFGWA